MEEQHCLLEVQVENLAHGGETVGTVVGSSASVGKKAFTRWAIPGETIEVVPTAERKSFVRAELSRVLEPSPHRITPPCPYFMRCGGCDLQHMALPAQREFKRSMVEETLKRQGGISPLHGVHLIGANLPGFGYRRRIVLHANKPKDGSARRIGFNVRKTHDLIDIDACLLAVPLLNQAIGTVRSIASELPFIIHDLVLEEKDGELYLVVKLWPHVQVQEDLSSSRWVILLGEKFPNLIVTLREKRLYAQYHGIDERAPGAQFPAGRFSQVNDLANVTLRDEVLKSVTQHEVTELYAGAGNFSFPLAEAGHLVEAVEVDPALVAYGESLVAEKKLFGLVKFYRKSCEKFVLKYSVRKSVILDPPRSGAEEVVREFDREKTKEVVYVSCSLPTLTRDLKILVAKGYQLQKVAVLDMFAQTHHVETISVLRAA